MRAQVLAGGGAGVGASARAGGERWRGGRVELGRARQAGPSAGRAVRPGLCLFIKKTRK
jgi:hypothetical protein